MLKTGESSEIKLSNIFMKQKLRIINTAQILIVASKYLPGKKSVASPFG